MSKNREHYWMKPYLMRAYGGGGELLLGPLQFNWYEGLRIHVTWPFTRTFRIREH